MNRSEGMSSAGIASNEEFLRTRRQALLLQVATIDEEIEANRQRGLVAGGNQNAKVVEHHGAVGCGDYGFFV